MEWISNNSDALMVIITFVYVIATCVICFFNAKSVQTAKSQIEALKKQVEESQTQQRQNIGVQLYEKRKEILKIFSDKKYNAIYWDIPILFNSSINSEFQNLCALQNRYDTTMRKIKTFETHLKETQETDIYDQYIFLVAQADEHDDYSQVYNFCEQYTYTQASEIDGDIVTYDFKELHEAAMALHIKIGSMHLSTFLKMQTFIKLSLSLEE